MLERSCLIALLVNPLMMLIWRYIHICCQGSLEQYLQYFYKHTYFLARASSKCWKLTAGAEWNFCKDKDKWLDYRLGDILRGWLKKNGSTKYLNNNQDNFNNFTYLAFVYQHLHLQSLHTHEWSKLTIHLWYSEFGPEDPY